MKCRVPFFFVVFAVSREVAHEETLTAYPELMEKKVFWTAFALLGLIADLTLPFWWAVAATFPALGLAWWIAYRSDWF